jgi:hypothetical protein
LPEHWDAVKRVLRYLAGTLSLGLIYCRNSTQVNSSNSHITLGPAFADANWAGDVDNRRSTTGFVLTFAGAAFCWRSTLQSVVAQSTAEAEYIAIGETIKSILWARQLLGELGFVQTSPTVLYCDNKAAIQIALNDMVSSRSKHIDIRHHFIRQHIREGSVELKWIASQDQLADILTKSLGRLLFTRCRDLILGMKHFPHFA